MRRAMHVDEVALEEPLVRQLLAEPVQVMTCVRLARRQGPTTPGRFPFVWYGELNP